MQGRLKDYTAYVELIKPLIDYAGIVRGMGLEQSLLELVKIRASQINGCANCLHMHTSDARAAGESEERIYLLDAWRESSMYTARERAALAWTEALTRVYETHAPDADYDGLKPHFSPAEIVHLTVLIGAINPWNRIAIGFRAQHPNDKRLAVREAA